MSRYINFLQNHLDASCATHNLYGIDYLRLNETFFYFKSGYSDTCVITFHGAYPRKERPELPIFRGFNWNFADGTNLLCFADAVLHHYVKSGLRLSWFLDTEIVQQVETICSIIDSTASLFDIKNLIFTGSSGGGFPALRFASLFGQYALISNSQIKLQKCPYFSIASKILADSGDAFAHYDIYKIMSEASGPKLLINYFNLDDETTYTQHLELSRWLRRRKKDSVLDIPFCGNASAKLRGVSNHRVLWPGSQGHTGAITHLKRIIQGQQ